jgi:hypothetical protein
MKTRFNFAALLAAALLLAPCAHATDTGFVTSSAPNYTPFIGQPGNLSLDTSGNLRVTGTVTSTPSGTQTVSGTVTANQGTAAANSASWPVVMGAYSNSHIAATGTTTAKSGAGLVHTVCINTKGASSNVLTLYDNTAGSGTVIAVIDTTANVGCLTYDYGFATGLTAVDATGTAPDVSITYK